MQAAIGSGFYQAIQDKTEGDKAHRCCGRCLEAPATDSSVGEVRSLREAALRADDRQADMDGLMMGTDEM
jgi:hypothetical protein